jgi:hypothetical protein
MHTELRRSAHLAWLAAALLALGGCTLVGDFGRYTYEDEDASAPDAASGDLGADADLADAGRDAEFADFGVDAGPPDMSFDWGRADLGVDSGPSDLGFDAGASDLGGDAALDAGPPFDLAAYFKASNTGAIDNFGSSVALSADGSTLAVGAYLEDSAATGVGGVQASNAATDSGAVYVFRRTAGIWAQEAYIKASNTGASDRFGRSITLSADGAVLAVGAYLEDSAATGVGGVQASNAATDSGAVYVFRRSASVWAQEAYIKASNTGVADYFGIGVALSADGAALAVGAYGEDSAATGVGGDQTSNAASGSGAVYMFRRTAGVWAQEAYIKASNTGTEDLFGLAVTLSADGAALAVGAQGEASAATGVYGDQTSNAALNSGAVYVFSRAPGGWAQEAYVKASNTGASDNFGWSVALSADGDALAVGAANEDSAATGVGGDQTSNAVRDSGAVYVFLRRFGGWFQEAYVKASNTGAGDGFGWSVALSADGVALAVGAAYEDSAATGVGGDQTSNAVGDSGAVYVFHRTLGVWAQEAYVKASNTGAGDGFGHRVVHSPDGSMLAVGAYAEDSAATGVGGDQTSEAATDSGAVYVY